MLRHSCYRASSIIEACKFSSLFSKNLFLGQKCYHRGGISDKDENGEDVSSNQNREESNSSYRSDNQCNDPNFESGQNNRNFQNENYFSLRKMQDSFEQILKPATFNESDLGPVEKYLYVEHADVTQRSDEEAASYRKKSNITITGSNVPKPILKFEELCLPENLKKVILERGYSDPTAIQAQGWPIAMSGRDMVGISQAGSGKTLAFMIPAVLHALKQPSYATKKDECSPQVLVLAPTRELVQQIYQVSVPLCQSSTLYASCAYGGASKDVQLTFLQGANVCIATPGRLIYLVSEGSVNLKKCTFLVLDEADMMLDMKFEPQIRQIIGQIRPDRQTLMWSDTWPDGIQDIAEDLLNDYVKVTVGGGRLVANPNIEQNVYVVCERDKEDRLVALLKKIDSGENSSKGTANHGISNQMPQFSSKGTANHGISNQMPQFSSKVLIFAATKRIVDYLGYKLDGLGIKTYVLHGDVSQLQRDFVLNQFRSSNCVLVATDVAARGLDVSDVRHVVNFDMPTNIEDYIHRIGWTARGLSSGKSHSFFTSKNAGIATDLIDVLERANQTVNPELLTLVQKQCSGFPRGYQSRRGYNSSSSHRQRFDYNF